MVYADSYVYIYPGTQFTCFTGTQVHREELSVVVYPDSNYSAYLVRGSEFTCFTSTKAQILASEV